MSRTRAALTAAVVLSALALGGCSDDDPEPESRPSSSPAPTSPSTSATSGPVEPTMPPEATGSDAAAAEAFVKFYMEAVNYAQATGDVDGLRVLGRKCHGCDAGIAFIEDVYSKHGTLGGGRGRVVGLKTGFVGARHERAVVDCVIVSEEQNVDLPGSREDEVYPGGRQSMRFILESLEGGWVVRSLGAQ